MFSNHFKIAWRNLMKYKFISFINLFGLTIGLTCCLLILTYIVHELSYDRYNANADRVYRVTRSFNTQDGAVNLHLGTVAPPFGPLLQHAFPDIQKQTSLLDNGLLPIRYEDKKFNERGVFFADTNLFDVFSVNVVKGNPASALSDPFSVMLSEEIAQKYFGTQDPMNKMIWVSNRLSFKVTGIYKAFPSNAHIHPAVLLSFPTLKDSAVYGERRLRTDWGNNSFFTYLLLPEKYPVEKLEARLPAFIDEYLKGYAQKPSALTALHLQKLTDIHLKSHLDSEAEENGDITRVYIFSAIALFILLIACINYMNLSTARSTLRAKEIGIRKVVGAGKGELVAQFLSESVILCWAALLLALVLLRMVLPWLSNISGDALSVNLLLKWQIMVPLLLAPFVVGVLAGIYPALFMSAFQPVKTLKGLFKAGSGSISFRKVLVTAQFAISIVLIITTLVVYSQLRYIQNKSLGYDKERIVNMPYIIPDKQYASFRNELMQHQIIQNLARSSRVPTDRLLDEQGAATWMGNTLQSIKVDVKYVVADYDFIPTYGVPMAAGRNFSRSYGTDTTGFVLNETATRLIGWKTPEEAVGKRFRYNNAEGTIIGVMRDFHFESLRQKIIPLVLIHQPESQNPYGWISVKIAGSNVNAALSLLETTWKKYLPDTPFDYTFLDDNFSRLYKSENRQQTIFTIFSCIAIFIASLGLLGLSAFTITQRIKEIGVRKVLGANTRSIVLLLSKDFLKLVGIAALIAFPLAWYAMHNWLQGFAYRINMPWYVFIVAGVLAALVALTTVGFQAIKAAWRNPVKSLRSE